ncbi:hypothetical protein jhhlp_008622 [Lomentospora prolificans]|uniref:Protection of telomeres protein 1 n=1 Tax=Lomentospora prolificans TaxID=41688 RepID=A0A2N3MYJ6_9PEZI|nr:hypothetical protein jhhlp_008622 [Lomentospora prolificans]
MASSSLGTPSSTPQNLPRQIIPIRDILEEKVEPQQLVSFIGLVRDFRPPIATRGTDWKSSIMLFDASTEHDRDDFLLTIFRPRAQMPEVGAGDVIYVHSARVQRHGSSTLSALTTRSTRIYVFQASLIPKVPGCASRALRASSGLSVPSKDILNYVSTLYHTVDKSRVPDVERFDLMAKQAINVKQKYQQLKDVHDGEFYDLIVQVVRDPYDLNDYATIWVTDYTENQGFYPFLETATEGSVYGECAGFAQPAGSQQSARSGPAGKMSMQITCWEPHASVIRSKVKANTYLSLRNVQVRHGRNGANLEGFLREDHLYPSKINAEVLQPIDDSGDLDPRLKNLIRRKRNYELENKRKQNPPAASKSSKRRRAKDDDSTKQPTAKEKRAQLRATLQADYKRVDQGLTDMNPEVSCQNMDVPITTVASMLEAAYYNLTLEDVISPIRVPVPFNNAKYRIAARVTDFFPQTLEQFSYCRKVSEYEALTDYESDSDDPVHPYSLADDDGLDNFAGPRKWEWCFALQLEDASPQCRSNPSRVWVYVDNAEAQCLTGLDASDLRSDTQGLGNLRTQMAKLWGNLEEQKLRRKKTAGIGKGNKRKTKRSRDNIPPDNSDIEMSQGSRKSDHATKEAPVANKVFSCCIRQFGSMVKESNPDKADAGDGFRWKRHFGLFGTKISYLETSSSL